MILNNIPEDFNVDRIKISHFVSPDQLKQLPDYIQSKIVKNA